MLRGLIFDFDGVVVDSHPAHKRAWKALLKSVGREVSDEELEFVLEGQKREAILRHFLGNLTNEQIKNYGEKKNALFRNEVPQIKTVHGLNDLLTDVAGAGLSAAVASSAGRNRVDHVLAHLELGNRFQAVLTGDDVLTGKPDPAIFLLAAQRINLAPEQILVCEDGVSGVEAAKAAGMKCLAIAANGRGPRLQHAGADLVVQDFTSVRLDDLRRLFA